MRSAVLRAAPVAVRSTGAAVEQQPTPLRAPVERAGSKQRNRALRRPAGVHHSPCRHKARLFHSQVHVPPLPWQVGQLAGAGGGHMRGPVAAADGVRRAHRGGRPYAGCRRWGTDAALAPTAAATALAVSSLPPSAAAPCTPPVRPQCCKAGGRHSWRRPAHRNPPPPPPCPPPTAPSSKDRHYSLAVYILLRGITLLIRTGNRPQAPAALRALLAPTRMEHGDTLIMCACCSQIIYAFIMHPGTLPPSYVRFIRKQGAKELYVYEGIRVGGTGFRVYFKPGAAGRGGAGRGGVAGEARWAGLGFGLASEGEGQADWTWWTWWTDQVEPGHKAEWGQQATPARPRRQGSRPPAPAAAPPPRRRSSRAARSRACRCRRSTRSRARPPRTATARCPAPSSTPARRAGSTRSRYSRTTTSARCACTCPSTCCPCCSCTGSGC
jgi:hypothetical protein